MHSMRNTLFFLVNGIASTILSCNTALASTGTATSQSLPWVIGASILAATVVAYVAHRLRQPLLLAYIAAGAVLGPQIGFGWVTAESDIRVVSEIGLVLLLFMIGLELDLKKILSAGKTLLATGLGQFAICFVLGAALLTGTYIASSSGHYSFFGIPIQGGTHDVLYLAAVLALSSTTIVVKVLHEKNELPTLVGRLTLGVLVFQDLYAIMILGIQPSLSHPEMDVLFASLGKGVVLVAIAIVVSRYVLAPLFRDIAKSPELVLAASLAWCFLLCGIAGNLGLSIEMGALIAGAAMSAFPYHIDVLAKVISIRDFFVTLFFVSLGLTIPNPAENPTLVIAALILSGFLILSRFVALFPIMHFLRRGHRAGLIMSINLAQLSEFALVIGALGLKAGHIGIDTFTIITFTFVITAVTSTYLINWSHPIQHYLTRLLTLIGIRDLGEQEEELETKAPKEIAFVGFYHLTSALFEDMKQTAPELLDKSVVVDFNPVVLERLKKRGVRARYGDVSHRDTLLKAGVQYAKIIISTVPDGILKNTSNLRLLRSLRTIAPQAKIVVIASGPKSALELYAAGADYVLFTSRTAAQSLLPVIGDLLAGHNFDAAEAIKLIQQRKEVIS